MASTDGRLTSTGCSSSAGSWCYCAWPPRGGQHSNRIFVSLIFTVRQRDSVVGMTSGMSVGAGTGGLVGSTGESTTSGTSGSAASEPDSVTGGTDSLTSPPDVEEGAAVGGSREGGVLGCVPLGFGAAALGGAAVGDRWCGGAAAGGRRVGSSVLSAVGMNTAAAAAAVMATPSAIAVTNGALLVSWDGSPWPKIGIALRR